MDTESIYSTLSKSYTQLSTQIPSSVCYSGHYSTLLPVQTQSTQCIVPQNTSQLSPSSLNLSKFNKFKETLQEMITHKLSAFEVYQIVGKNGPSAREELMLMIISLLENPEEQLEDVKMQRNLENVCIYTDSLPEVTLFSRKELDNEELWIPTDN